ncbi:MAG: LysM peptidoglycan-binding domain-containing protein [Anaerolineales bacterium]|nr:LysM peptidoglycan-binding domain-containing protein [Anaerolineales bacterium]
MKRINFLIHICAALILTACNLGGGGATEAPAESQLRAAEATPTLTLADKVAIELTSQADTSIQYNTVGQIVKFKFTIRMTRNDSADVPPNIAFTGASPVCPAINSIGNLDERFDTGETMDCALDYPLTQADLDKSSLSLAVTVNIYSVNSNTTTATVATIPSKLLTLTKTAEPASYYQTGQSIKFNYTIKNSGSSPLGPGQFTVTDSAVNNNAAFNCGDANASLASGATLTCSAAYTVTAADMNAASIASVATAAGGGANPSAQVSVTLNKTSAPALASGATIQHTVIEGEWLWQIARCYGADPAKTIAANPQLANPAQIKAGTVVTVPNIGSNGKINNPPCVGRHLVQSGDTWASIASKYGADQGLLQIANGNILTVGKEVKVPFYTAGLNIPTPGAAPVVTPGVTTTPAPAAGLKLTVSALPAAYSSAGQAITFTYTIQNTGSSSNGPAQFTITDGLVSAGAFNCGSPTTLSPGATTFCTATYSVPQNVFDSAATVTSNATASGGGVTSAAVTTNVSKAVSQLTLTVTANPIAFNQVGQTIAFTYIIKNTGATTLGPGQFTVSDSLVSSTPINCGTSSISLPAGESITCNANLTITDELFAKSTLTSSATASGGGVTSAAVNTTITKQ